MYDTNSSSTSAITVTPEVAERWKSEMSTVVTPPLGNAGERWEHRKYAPWVGGKPIPRRIPIVAQRLWETIHAEMRMSPLPHHDVLLEDHLRTYVKVFGKSDAGKLSVTSLTTKLTDYVDLVRPGMERRWIDLADSAVTSQVVGDPVKMALQQFTDEHPQAPKVFVGKLTRALLRSARGSLSDSFEDDLKYLAEGKFRTLAGHEDKRSRPFPVLVDWNPQPVLDEYAAMLPVPAWTEDERAEWMRYATSELECFVAEHEKDIWVECRRDCGYRYQEERGGRCDAAFSEMCDRLDMHVGCDDLMSQVRVRISASHNPRITWRLIREHASPLTGEWEEVVAETTVKPTRTYWWCEGCCDALETEDDD